MKIEITNRDLRELLLLIADIIRATADRMQRAETPEPVCYPYCPPHDDREPSAADL